MIQWECKKSRPEMTCRRRVLISDGKNGSRISSSKVLRSCSRKSITRKTLFEPGARRPSTGLVNPSLHLELFTERNRGWEIN